MAVAVKSTPETTRHSLFDRLARDTVLGVWYVLASLWVVFDGLPALFRPETPVVWSLLILAMIVVGLGLIWLGCRLAGPQPPLGLRSGIFLGIVGVVCVAAITSAVGSAIEHGFGSRAPAVGIAVTAAVGALLLVGVGTLLLPGRGQTWLERLDEQGWFSWTTYKRSQGQRVRRGTMLGILVLAGCGIYTLLNHRTLETGARDWRIPVPFSAGHSFVLLPDLQFTVPILLALASFWIAWRVVNFPVFTDFLIATEAELNKVSWTTRKRLIQDTIVVLVTVFLLTFFLFVADVVWAQVLTKLTVLQKPTAAVKNEDKLSW